MNISEILKLIDAGYTKAEIEAMDKQTQVGDDEKIEHQKELPKPEHDVEKNEHQPTPVGDAEKIEHPANDDETRKLVQALGLKFDNLVSAIQASNVKKMEMPTDTMTAESIIAGMIDPQYNNKGGK